VVLSLSHEEIPPHLHLQSLNPHISLKEIPATVATERTPWTVGDRSRIAGVSSFGFSGTNAHVVLEEAPARKQEEGVAACPSHVLCLSAWSEVALRNLARRYETHLAAHPTEDLGAVCHTAGAGRSHFEHRLAIVAKTVEEAEKELKAYVGGTRRGWISGKAPDGESAKVAFVFSHPDTGFDGTGRELFESHQKFREALARCDEIAQRETGRGVLAAFHVEKRSLEIKDQASSKDLPLFALEYGLLEMWRSWGVEPGAVLGKGVGECVAGCCAGVIDLEDALRLVAARERFTQKAAHASAGQQTSGAAEREAKRSIDGELTGFDLVANELEFRTPRLPFISSLTGRRVESREIAGKEYWRPRPMREAQIREGVVALWEEGFRIFVEIGPGSALDARTAEWVAGKDGAWLPTLTTGHGDWEQALRSLSGLYLEGVEIDWKGLYANHRHGKVILPTYPFERRRFWVDGAHEHPSPAPAFASAQRPVNDWLYGLEWQRQASQERWTDHLPSPVEIAGGLGSTVARLNSDFGLDLYRDLLPQTDILSVAYAVQALLRLGWEIRPGDRMSCEFLANQLRVVPRHRRLFDRILQMLAETGVLRKDQSDWLVSRMPDAIDPEELRAALMSQYPACEGELSLFASCGQKLAEVLRGECDPLQILFPGGSVARVEKLYQYSPFFQAMNTLVGEAFTKALEGLPPNRKVRILEVGAGTGGTTSYILSRLPADRVEYFFTDVSALFTVHAAPKFAAYPFVSYGLLDIERDLAAQGFADGTFDLVVAANVLHATADLRHSLRQVRRLLAPDGLLLLLEGTRPQLWADLVFGLTEGWWKFADADLRRSHTLISKRRWLRLLTETDFTEAAAVPEDSDQGRSSQQVLFVARATGVVAPVEPSPETGTWLVFADKGGVGEKICQRLREHGSHCVTVTQGEGCRITTQGHCVLNAGDRVGFDRLMEYASAKSPRGCRGVVHLWSLDSPNEKEITPESLEAAAISNCASVLHLVHTLQRDEGPVSPHIWLVTRGAQPAGPLSKLLSLAQAPIWGLGRVIALEHPEIWGGLIDLDPETAPDEATAILDLVQSSSGEDQIAIRRGENYVARLIPGKDIFTPPAKPRFKAEATYLITGGLGVLGLRIARWMVEHGARHLALLGIVGLPERARWADLAHGSESWKRAAAVQELEHLGARIQVIESDVSDEKRVVPIVQALVDADPPLKGIIHAAGIFPPLTVQSLDLEALRSVFRPKVAGGWILHQATKNTNLDFFVSFSSAAAIWGTRGGAHYAAANHFLDALAQYRHALSLPALSINWARWEGGMASGEVERFFDLIGLSAMQSPQALDVMGDLMQAGVVQKTVAAVDWNVFKPIYEAKRRRPLLEQIQAAGKSVADRPSGSPSMIRRFEQTSPGDRWDMMLSHVKTEVAKVLGFGPGEEPALDEGFFKMGMDSLTSVELRTRLEATLGRSLPATLAFEHSTVETLARHLYSELFGNEPEISPIQADVDGNSTATLLAGLEQLSEDAARTELLEELANLKRDLQ